MRTIIKKCVFIIVVLGIISIGPFADFFEFEPSSISFKVSALDETGKCGSNVTYTFDKNTGTLTFTGTGEMYCWRERFEIFGIIPVVEPLFGDNKDIKRVIISEGITNIDDSCFEGCSNLTEVVIPSTVTKIERYSLSETGLKRITIPQNVTYIDSYAFSQCYQLQKINVDSNNNKYSSDSNGVLYNKEKNELILFPKGSQLENYILPDTVKSLKESVFSGCTSITKITLHKGITTIPSYAFSECDNLQIVSGCGAVQKIEEKAFNKCKKLEKTDLDSTVTSISTNIFYDCINLKSVDFLENIQKISGQAFYNCDSLTSITFGNKLTDIYTEAFYGCSNISSVIVPESVKMINEKAFYDCDSLSDITIYNDKCDLKASCIQKETKIFGRRNSTAQTYANENGNVFIPIEDHTHSYGLWETIVEASCETEGLKKRTCSACGESETKNISATGHNYNSSWTVDKKATCTESGSKSHHCINCDAKKDVTVIKATGHSYGEWQTVSGAVCTKGGTRKKVCENCGDSVVEDVVALGHNYSTKWTVDKKATCVSKGSKSHHCINCGDKKDVTSIEKTEHKYKTKTTKATTKTNGKKVYTCSVCNDVVTKVIAKIKTIKLSKTNYTYNKKVKTPSVIVKDSKGNSLKKGTHYTVTYSKGRKAVGTYSVKIVFKGNYSGSKTLKFTVTLGKVTNLEQIKSEKGIAFSWNSVVGATGYQIYTYDTKTKQYFLLVSATKTRLKNANAKGIMSFKVRAYYKAKDGTMHYGEFSDVKTFKSI